MKVLLTGGTGFVGQEILRGLDTSGHSVRLLVRNRDSRPAIELGRWHRAELAQGNVLEADSLDHACQDIGAVVHLVGIISEVDSNTFESVHIQGTGNIVRAAERAGVLRLVHMSALGTRPGAVSRYHQSKWAAEEIVRNSRSAWTIFRPSIIYGPGDKFVNLFAKLARYSPILPVMGSGQGKLEPVAVEAVAQAFVGALDESRAVSRTFDLCGKEVFTFNEVLDQIISVAGRRRLKLNVPMPLARMQARLMEFVFPRLLRRAAPLNRDQLIMLEEDNAGDWRPATELFRLEHGTFRAGIAKYLRR